MCRLTRSGISGEAALDPSSDENSSASLVEAIKQLALELATTVEILRAIRAKTALQLNEISFACKLRWAWTHALRTEMS